MKRKNVRLSASPVKKPGDTPIAAAAKSRTYEGIRKDDGKRKAKAAAKLKQQEKDHEQRLRKKASEAFDKFIKKGPSMGIMPFVTGIVGRTNTALLVAIANGYGCGGKIIDLYGLGIRRNIYSTLFRLRQRGLIRIKEERKQLPPVRGEGLKKFFELTDSGDALIAAMRACNDEFFLKCEEWCKLDDVERERRLTEIRRTKRIKRKD